MVTMNRRLLVGIIATIIVTVGMVIAGVIIRPAFITLGIGVALFGVWIFLVYMVRKKITGLFDEQTEPETAERRLKMLKALVLAAGISLAVGIVCAILHNAIYALFEKEQAISFVFAIVGLFGFVIATIGGLVIFLKGRRKTQAS